MAEFRRRRAQFNKAVMNRLVTPWSGRLSMWSNIEHVGRRSGRTYVTPVSMFTTGDGVAVLLAYGLDTDWVKNLQAAGEGRVTLNSKTFRVVSPRIVPTAQAAEQVKAPWRQMMRVSGIKSTLLLTRAD